MSRELQVLLVEDNLINQKVMTKLLESVGEAGIEAVETGEKALSRLQEDRFDLVFMDIQLEGIDGLEATRRIRALQSGATGNDVPVVILSGYSDEQTEDEARRAGANRYLLKPVSPQMLSSLLGELELPLP